MRWWWPLPLGEGERHLCAGQLGPVNPCCALPWHQIDLNLSATGPQHLTDGCSFALLSDLLGEEISCSADSPGLDPYEQCSRLCCHVAEHF